MIVECEAQGTIDYDGEHVECQGYDYAVEDKDNNASTVEELAAYVSPLNGFDLGAVADLP